MRFLINCFICNEQVKRTFVFECYIGKPGQGIVESAEKNGCEMIVMGSRGFGKFKRTILGSVSDYVVHNTSVPVLICPV